MENLFYIIAVIGYFLYQAYQNFQKEQEKARKRNPGKAPEVEVYPEEVVIEPFIGKSTKTIELKPDYKAEARELMVKDEREAMVYEKLDRVSLTGHFTHPIKQKAKKHVAVSKGIQRVTLEEEILPDNHIVDFDLKDAIIKEAILNKPY
ncbi:hypothetical protein [Pseudopedobacter beijingensis]|uniref:Uncharacterized protein n=1 Tax=Pseudopedobacter beijingensis TaxID=1207056 RepID=A0ABW4ICK9_9SPHI